MNNKVVKLEKTKAQSSSPEEVASRPAYTGGLATEELLRPGGKLLAMLVARSNQLGMKLADMCQVELGVTYGYLHQLRNGMRKTSNISEDFATRCAIFLGVPRLTVLMAADRVSLDDYFDRQRMVATEIRRAMQFVMDDPIYGVSMLPEVMDLQLTSQFAIVQLYEKATGKKILDKALTMESLVAQLAELDEVVAKLKAQVGAQASAEAEAPATA